MTIVNICLAFLLGQGAFSPAIDPLTPWSSVTVMWPIYA